MSTVRAVCDDLIWELSAEAGMARVFGNEDLQADRIYFVHLGTLGAMRDSILPVPNGQDSTSARGHRGREVVFGSPALRMTIGVLWRRGGRLWTGGEQETEQGRKKWLVKRERRR